VNSEHDFQTTLSNTDTFDTPPGLGPGIGDRFIYLQNAKCVWLTGNNELSLTVLGSDGIRAFTAKDMLSDAQALAPAPDSAMGPITGLDRATIAMLLALDPFVPTISPNLDPERFVQNDPLSAQGRGTGGTGDILAITHELTTTDVAARTNVTLQITDYKPGWLIALFDDNTATEHQVTASYGAGNQVITDTKLTATVHFVASPTDPPYAVGLYFDRLFGTIAFTPWPP
jgi:hypothetical protein